MWNNFSYHNFIINDNVISIQTNLEIINYFSIVCETLQHSTLFYIMDQY